MKDEYIGRNALLSIITTKFNEHYGNASYQLIHDFYRFVIRRICDAPAADVVEVRHGRWEYVKRRYEAWTHRCSECGEIMTTQIGRQANCCHNCGCKMDKEE